MLGRLTLSDGTFFLGQSFGANLNSSGEVVFNTGMVGYTESLTDPSYFGQILVLTYPLIGNYGVPDKKFWESTKIQVKALIIQNYINTPSHFESQRTLSEWLISEGIPALQGVDTRALTRRLREQGVMPGELEVGIGKLEAGNSKIFDPNSENVLPFVSTKQVESYGQGSKNILLIDCGDKENIIRSLVKRKVKVTKVPWDFNLLKAKFNYDGILISNGPGDPKQAQETILNIRQVLQFDIPVFGICLGSQILALAASCQQNPSVTYKLKFGHRGQNQPVKNLITGKALITSQNHGFAVNMKALSKDWEEWFINLNDGSNEGIRHKSKPLLAVQFHPEANPGPFDAGFLFDEFIKLL